MSFNFVATCALSFYNQPQVTETVGTGMSVWRGGQSGSVYITKNVSNIENIEVKRTWRIYFHFKCLCSDHWLHAFFIVWLDNEVAKDPLNFTWSEDKYAS